MTLKNKIAACSNFEAQENLAYPGVYLNRKTVVDFLGKKLPKEQVKQSYQAYINYYEYVSFVQENGDVDICLQVRARGYFSSFKSNIIKIDF